MTYPEVPAQPSFPSEEVAVLARWEAEGTFQASIDRREGADEYVFYDGPPFANGLPHYGHLLTGFVKDAVPRYQTMRGQQVHRRFGWDCHGLPAEVVAERELGISGHPAIARFGIDRFNAECRRSVLQFTDDWHRYVTRQARWVDFHNDYKTLDLPYMESVMWAFKTLWDKGLVYEGFRVLAYCWRCETPLSNTETRMDDVYRDRQDPALTVMFELDSGEQLLAWTTTPWTLPSNLALAVGAAIDYAVMEEPATEPGAAPRRYVLAEARLDAYARELAGAQRVGTVRGSELIGRRYRPLFEYLAGSDAPGMEHAFQVLGADFVSVEDGTGVVHLSPGHGEEDQIACTAAGIPTLCPMDERGAYTAEITAWAGMHVFDANPEVIKALKAKGAVVRHDTYAHSYPHCWRCAEPLVYRAISSWFVRVTAFRERMVELNQQIRWVPEHLRDGSFGKWLANARDWSISRNRFWGSPIPVWRSDNPEFPRLDCYGSLAALERDFGVVVTDLHRPEVDELVRPNPDDPSGRSMMRRVPEVLDCWFESGSMPFAQVHYPFENREWFDSHYPGDFIVEYIGQTRGWFYTLHVLATALFDTPAFETCVSHGIILGNDGQKMSKSLRNYPDPMEMFDTYGSDAVRWYLLSSTVLRGTDLAVTEEGIREAMRQVILPLWNTWSFLSIYARAADRMGTWSDASSDPLDRYILAKTRSLVTSVGEAMDSYDLFAACAQIRTFLDALTNWYVRRSRERFWAGDADALNTLHTVLATVCRVAAPLLPLTTEMIYRPLTGEASVHLTDWPEASELPADDALVERMDLARDVCSNALRLRKSHHLRVRQPLRTLTVASGGAAELEGLREVIASELNVKDVRLVTELDGLAHYELSAVPAALGPRLGGRTQQVIRAIKAGEWEREGERVIAGGIELAEGEYQLRLVVAGEGAATALDAAEGVVVLDTELDESLIGEGQARDLVRVVQQARRELGLAVSDRVELSLAADQELSATLAEHEALIAEAVLATVVRWEPVAEPVATAALDGRPISVGIRRA